MDDIRYVDVVVIGAVIFHQNQLNVLLLTVGQELVEEH
jgi:hypothetical protein